jgi:hypothetical protein
LEHPGTDSLLIYVSQITARVTYIVKQVLPFATLTDSRGGFISYTGPKICYAKEKFSNNALWIVPHGLLDEQGIREQKIICSEWKGKKIFFTTAGDIPFDFFAASFYLLSRYEEYLPHEKDQYGRYSHTNSIAYKEGFLNLPLINVWIRFLETEIKERCTHPKFKIHPADGGRTFEFIPTYDIDEAFSYLHKPVLKNVFGFFRDLLRGKFEKVMERGNVYSGNKSDPFDTFDWIDSLHKKYSLNPVYFFLTIIKRGEYDKNLPANAKPLQDLYRRLSVKYISGIHPSWQSGTDEWLLEKEIGMLQNIIQKPVTVSRNHYLRFTVPHTYRRLIAAGISDDYSMAYGSVNGFRSSYALPHKWYDLEKEETTSLTIHTFCFMEAAAFFSQGFSAEQAAVEMQYYHDIVKKVNGEFITLFHNHFLTEQPEWVQWRQMYADFLEKNF